MKYDCIVIGAGIAGLVAALTLQKKGKKVLILEKGLTPGGISTSFVRGRFEFDANIFPFYGFQNKKEEGYELLKRLGLSNKIEFITPSTLFYLYDKDMKEEYVFPVGIDDFIMKMEEYVPKSTDAMTTFFGLCEEVEDALTFIEQEKGSLDEKDLKQKFPNFIQLAPWKVDKVLEFIKMPKKVTLLLSNFNHYLGSSFKDLSFVYFAHFIYLFVKYGVNIPKNTSHELSRTLENEFVSLGGVIQYHSLVEEILVNNEEVEGVISNNEKYLTKHIIANLSPKKVYGSMIKSTSVPPSCFQLENERILGPTSIAVFLGLNKSKNELGLDYSTYIFTNNLDFEKEISKLDDVFSGHFMCTVKEVDKDSTILVLSSLIFKNAFEKFVHQENYLEMKEQLEDYFVTLLESELEISIRENIEEIEIATPVTYERYTNHPHGSLFGYMAKGYDNLLPRMFSEEKENVISGLRFCGSYGAKLSMSLDTLKNGEEVALKTFGECEE